MADGCSGDGRLSAQPWAFDLSRRRYERIKRLLDVVIVLGLLPFAALAIAPCALLIRLESRGPILFTQQRTGRGGRSFSMYKLRSMVPDAPALRQDLLYLNRQSGPDFKIKDDPRVTRVGRFLRKTSLDEVPQLWNVLRGEMSLVGPRPTSFAAETYELWHTERLEVPPGMTGLWQVSGRGDIDFDDRVRLDIAYIAQRSLLLDLRILLRTIGALRGRGAY